MIGLKRGTIKLVKHNSQRLEAFEQEAKNIKNIFGNKIVDLQHVGSTAIPGIVAKPIIDMILTVPSLKKFGKYTAALEKIDYKLKMENRKDRLFFTKGPEDKRTHYLHIAEKDSGYDDMTVFRDYMRKHHTVARAYNNLKQRLAARYASKRNMYSDRKRNFIAAVIRRAKSRPPNIMKKVQVS